jgi:hypothetical protein
VRHGVGLGHCFRKADDLEGVVDASAIGELLHLGHRIAVRRIDEVRGTEVRSRLPLQLQGIDCDDARRSGNPRALHGGLADTATSDHRYGGAGLNTCGVKHCSYPCRCRHAATDEGQLLVREIGADLHDRALVYRHLLGKGAEADETEPLGPVRTSEARHELRLGRRKAEMRLLM